MFGIMINTINLPANEVNRKSRVYSKKISNSEQAGITASSLEALDIQGRALVNLSFRGKESEEITDEKFEDLKKEFFQKLKTLSKTQQTLLKDFVLNKSTINLALKIVEDERLYDNDNFLKNIINIDFEKKEQIELANDIFCSEELLNNKKFIANSVHLIYSSIDSTKLEIGRKIIQDKRLYENDNFIKKMGLIVSKPDKRIKLIQELLNNKKNLENEKLLDYSINMLYWANNEQKADIAEIIMNNKNLYENEKFMDSASSMMYRIQKNENYVKDILLNKSLLEKRNFANNAGYILANSHNVVQQQLINKIISDDRLYGNESFLENSESMLDYVQYRGKPAKFIFKVLSDEKLLNNKNFVSQASKLLSACCDNKRTDLVRKVIENKEFIDNEEFLSNAANLIANSDTAEKINLTNFILGNENLLKSESFMEHANRIIFRARTSQTIDIFKKIMEDKKFYDNKNFMESAIYLFYFNANPDETLNLLNKDDIVPIQMVYLSMHPDNIDKIKQLNECIGSESANKLNYNGTKILSNFVDIYEKEKVEEIPLSKRREFIRNLISANDELFKIPDDIRNKFPLLPKNQEDYCKLIPYVISSLAIEINTLNNKEIKEFYENIAHLGKTLSKMTDEQFKEQNIEQAYSKNKFIENTLKLVCDLSKKERQKVFDYFGFELQENQEASYEGGYSLVGYPVISTNKEKYAAITELKTQEAVKKLSIEVKKFTQNNKITCKNKELEECLNKVIAALPELRTAIGNKQHDTHKYKDLFTHSLKVMHGIVTDSKFQELNETDKKIIILASLLHDITKKEGCKDEYHAKFSSIDAYFIAKKFKLSQEEEIKLFNLIKNHEWLKDVNLAKTQKAKDKEIQSIAYEFRHSNMFDMITIFTKADLKGVSDEFYDIHNKEADYYANEIPINYKSKVTGRHIKLNGISGCIEDLKKTQPLLPITRIPSSIVIKRAITEEKPDGRTNIKGIYKGKNGLIVIKYNELQNEDLEKIGFKSKSRVRGTKAISSKGERINTGNIKFFVHGLEEPYQLVKFNAFGTIDSDVLLSVSYAERPESKYRFYRPQGIILDCDTKYVHGGGYTDAGSGREKCCDDFKKDYLFGADREQDRSFVSDLIKKTLKLDTAEYINFVNDNENLSLSEIGSPEKENKLIKAFAAIESRERSGKREYNEMYITNPKPPMAVFAYNIDYNEEIENPLDFLNREIITEKEEDIMKKANFKKMSVKSRTEFLRDYAIKNNIPFILFGN